MTTAPQPAASPASDGGAFLKHRPWIAPLALLDQRKLYEFAARRRPDQSLTDPATGRHYLDRWILNRSDAGVEYLHRFNGPDPNRAPHDHPYDFVSVILDGGYIEETGAGDATRTVTRSRGDVILRRAEDPHSITQILKPGHTWSLVMGGIRFRQWGFHTADGWIDWETYIRDHEPEIARLQLGTKASAA